jgi:hypothetical protein
MYAENHKASEQLRDLTDEVLDKLNLSRNKISVVKTNAKEQS